MKDFFLLGFILINFGLIAQKLKVSMGDQSKAVSRGYFTNIIAEDKDHLYGFTTDIYGSKKIYLEKINKHSLNRVYFTELKTSYLTESGPGILQGLKGVNVVDGNFIIFIDEVFYKRKSSVLSALVLNGDLGTVEKKTELLEMSYDEVYYSLGSGFDVRISPDNDLMAVRFRGYASKLNQSVEKFKLFNTEFEEVLEKTITTEGDYKEFSNFFIDLEGSIYFGNENELVVYDANQDYESWSQKIELEEMEAGAFLKDFQISINDDNDIILVGEYCTTDAEDTKENKNRKDRSKGDVQVEGMFFIKIDGISKEIVTSEINLFDKEFINKFKTKRDFKKNRDIEINDVYNHVRVINKLDGGIIILAEKQVFDGTLLGSGGEKYYEDLMCFNFNSDGKMLWAERIPKSQRYKSRGLLFFLRYGSYGASILMEPYYRKHYLSYISAISNDKLYIIYSDHLKNEDKKIDGDELKTMSSLRKSVPMVYTIDLKTGERKKEVDMGLISGKNRIRPTMFYQASQNNPVYFMSGIKRKFQFGRIDFNKLSD